MKGIIIYKGKYGATRQYAQWLGETLNLQVANADKIPGETLPGYDFFIIGSSVYIGKLQISKWLKVNQAILKGKKIFFFQVAATPPDEKEKLEAYIRSGVPEEIRSQCEFYFYRGKMIFNDLSWKDRLLLKMGASLIKDPVVKKGMLTNFNDLKKENIVPMVNAIKEFISPKKTMQPV